MGGLDRTPPLVRKPAAAASPRSTRPPNSFTSLSRSPPVAPPHSPQPSTSHSQLPPPPRQSSRKRGPHPRYTQFDLSGEVIPSSRRRRNRASDFFSQPPTPVRHISSPPPGTPAVAQPSASPQPPPVPKVQQSLPDTPPPASRPLSPAVHLTPPSPSPPANAHRTAVAPASPHPPHLFNFQPNGAPNLDIDAEVQFWADGGDQNLQLGQRPLPLSPAPPSQQSTQDATQSTLPLPQPAFLPSLAEAHSTYVPTHKWPPKSVRPESTRTLTSLLNHLSEHPQDKNAWVQLSIYHRCVLPALKGPELGDASSNVQLIRDRLRRWQAGECGELWQEAVQAFNNRPKKKKKNAVAKTQEQWNVERAVTLAQDGQYARALTALTSLGMAEHCQETVDVMRRKHPPPLQATKVPHVTARPKAFSPSEVRKAAESFARGGAAGPCGMRPEHLLVALKVTPGNRGDKACSALTKLVNILAAGSLPSTVAPYFCGARLHAAKKKDDGLRPIAVGNIIQRLVSKCFATALADKAASILKPHQLGVGCQGGCEAATHAVRDASQQDPSLWVLQCDLVNAFNQVDRSHMLAAVAEHFPECLPWAISCYSQDSHLQFGDTSISSSTGLRQGCPLAATFFCVTLQPVVESVQQQVPTLQLNVWFHDDGHLVGTLPELEKVVSILEREGPPRDLILSTAATVSPPSLPKTKLWCPMDISDEPYPLRRGITKARSGIIVLGAPVRGLTNLCATNCRPRLQKWR